MYDTGEITLIVSWLYTKVHTIIYT